MDDATRLKEEKANRRAQAVRDENINSALQALTEHLNGRQLLWWLMEIGKCDVATFTGHALSGAFLQGEQNVGLQIKQRLMTATPLGFISMLKENYDNGRRTEQSDPTTRPGVQSDSEPEPGPSTYTGPSGPDE